MTLSRRKFVALATLALCGLGGTGLIALKRRRARGRRDGAHGGARRQPAEAPSKEIGELRAGHVLTLRKLAECYTGVPLESDADFTETPFDRYFQYRALRDAGYRSRIESMLERLASLSRERHGREFVMCDREKCLALIAGVFPAGTVLEGFTNEIQRPILIVYTRTYAWIDMGYRGWPGQPRGLEHYQQAPIMNAPIMENG